MGKIIMSRQVIIFLDYINHSAHNCNNLPIFKQCFTEKSVIKNDYNSFKHRDRMSKKGWPLIGSC